MTTIQYSGYVSGKWDEEYIDGSLESLKFLTYYCNKGKVQAVASCGRSPDVMILSEALRLGVMPSLEDIKSGSETVATIKKKVIERKGENKCQRENCCKKKATNA
jgi:hypothetical protein